MVIVIGFYLQEMLRVLTEQQFETIWSVFFSLATRVKEGPTDVQLRHLYK